MFEDGEFYFEWKVDGFFYFECFYIFVFYYLRMGKLCFCFSIFDFFVVREWYCSIVQCYLFKEIIYYNFLFFKLYRNLEGIDNV